MISKAAKHKNKYHTQKNKNKNNKKNKRIIRKIGMQARE
jgi:hypothetical protein